MNGLNTKCFTGLSRTIHTLNTLPFASAQGVGNFLSPKSVATLLQLQSSYLGRVNELVAESRMNGHSLYQIVEQTTRYMKQEGRISEYALLYFYASQAWNMDFFLQGLTVTAVEPIDRLLAVIEKNFGSMSRFRQLFVTTAAATIGSGWTWLVSSPSGKLKIITTFNGGTPLFNLGTIGSFVNPALDPTATKPYPISKTRPTNQPSTFFSFTNTAANGKGEQSFANHSAASTLFSSNDLSALFGSATAPSKPSAVPGEQSEVATEACLGSTQALGYTPLLGLNMWEHSYLLDYGLDKESYVLRYLNHVNWNRPAVMLNIY